MKVNVCFVCLKTVKNSAFKRNADGKDVDDLNFKFWRFAGGSDPPFLQAGELKLMESSESRVSHKLEQGLSHRWLNSKVKSQEALPEILIHRVKLPPSFATLLKTSRSRYSRSFLEADRNPIQIQLLNAMLPRTQSNESHSDSQSDREPASIKSNAKSPRAHHQPPKEENRKQNQCQHCGKVLISSQRLRHHIFQVHRGHPFQCAECSKSFKTKAALKDHAIRTHSETIKLTRHINFTHSDKRYKCDECGVELKSKVLLNNHIIAFHKPEAHGCAECGKVFKSRTSSTDISSSVPRASFYVRTSKTPGADNHFRTVVRWDDTAGPDADGKFPCPKYLKLHPSARLTPKDQVCPHCGKTLATGYIPIHIKLVHPELAPEPRARVQCPSCLEGFYTKRQLEKHLLECAGRNNHRSEQNT
ncbi:putative zinc finger protein [Orchesella cincta]|uniref:Putative zinc finger protein n=1 Tax=Orchesella cincta TaxID=48709 RepID=A0A1D2M496_ORCCI|nr:putative zinc finger protein [Orchesella cincta]